MGCTYLEARTNWSECIFPHHMFIYLLFASYLRPLFPKCFSWGQPFCGSNSDPGTMPFFPHLLITWVYVRFMYLLPLAFTCKPCIHPYWDNGASSFRQQLPWRAMFAFNLHCSLISGQSSIDLAAAWPSFRFAQHQLKRSPMRFEIPMCEILLQLIVTECHGPPGNGIRPSDTL